MKFSIFNSVRSQRGERCTEEKFREVSASAVVRDLCKAIAAEPDHDKRGALKKQLPIITFQAFFEGARKNAEAQPSGCFIFDGDGMEKPREFYEENVSGRLEELGILYAGLTPSQHGLRLVARMRPEFASIADAQKWLSGQVGWECDAACKDLARASYVVPKEYVYFLDQALFTEDGNVGANNHSAESSSGCVGANNHSPETSSGYVGANNHSPKTDVNESSSGCADAVNRVSTGENQHTFKGIPLVDLCHEWLVQTGGEPEEGERNTRLHALAYELRYITDFNEQTLLAVMPNYGLPEEEMKGLIHSACNAQRSKTIPRQLEQVMQKLRHADEEGEDDGELEEMMATNPQLNYMEMPTLPPLIRQIAQTAPDDFRTAAVICTLPILGTLGSKLRARYLDGHLHSPSFQVSLEAPQASGKSFMSRLAEMLMRPITIKDEEERQKEQEYMEKMSELKVTNVKVTAKNRDELLGQKPKGIIRFVPATISITKLLMRLDNARGLHLFAVAEEIDTVTKAFKRGFSSYGDLLRVAFDNGRYGQDYASDTSFSGIVRVYYNTLFSGTPKAMRRFYPDVEDGLVSRVCFVQLPDQFGKAMPVWGTLSAKDNEEVERQMARLDQVSIEGNTVKPDHEMTLDFLNRAMEQWLKAQQEEAVRTDDRTRDIFCRRAAVVGFRAGMLAWFLYGEKNSRTYRSQTVDFALWVATQMLNQHLLRFQIEGTGSNTNRWEEAYKLLKDEFTREELVQALNAIGSTTPVKHVVYRWKLLGCIAPVEAAPAPSGHRQTIRFRKVKNPQR